MLAGQGKSFFFRAVCLPARNDLPGAVVGGEDAVAGRLPVFSPQIEPLPVTAQTNAGNILWIDMVSGKQTLNHQAVIVPHLHHISFDEVGRRCEGSGGNALHRQLGSVLCEKCCLGGGASVIQAEIVFHCRRVPFWYAWSIHLFA